MEQTFRWRRAPSCLGQFDGEMEREASLESLEKENDRLRELVVRLSETIIRNVVAGK